MVAPFSKFYNKIWVGFCLNTGKHFFVELSLKANAKSIGMFLCDNQWKFWTSSISNFEIDYLENKNLFLKNGVPFFSWKH